MKVQKEILQFIESINDKSTNNKFIDIGALSKVDTEILGEILSIDLKGYKHGLDVSGVLHALKHKNITTADLLLIPFIIKNYDVLGKGKKENTIVYKKKINDTYYYVEEVRKGRKKLMLKTLYKQKKRPKKGTL